MTRKPRRSIQPALTLLRAELIVGVSIWGITLFFVGLWSHMQLLSHSARSEFKSFILGPALGDWSLLGVLTAINCAWFLLILVHVVDVCRSRSRPRWLAIALVAVCFLPLAVMHFTTVNMRAAANRFNNDSIMSDDAMLRHFADRRLAYQSLLKMVQTCAKEHPNKADIHWIHFYKTHMDWRRLNELLNATSTFCDLHVSDHGRRIEFEHLRNGIGDRAWTKSYVHSEEEPKPLLSSLDALARQEQSNIGFRQIEGSWYLRFSRKR